MLLAEVARGAACCSPATSSREGQAALARAWPGLAVDVLKVPHHGSRYQDLDFLLGARRAGWRWSRSGPTTTTATRPPRRWRRSTAAGARVLRTDLDGDLAVVVATASSTVTER